MTPASRCPAPSTPAELWECREVELANDSRAARLLPGTARKVRVAGDVAGVEASFDDFLFELRETVFK